MKHEKIGPHHLERKAILYVRQSSAHQVLHNRESGALQYAMRDRLATLGWSRIETIDDDLGRSAAGGVTRAGFDRMVAEVCLGKVGAVAAREVSRFARNSRDWQPPIEMCRVVDSASRHRVCFASRLAFADRRRPSVVSSIPNLIAAAMKNPLFSMMNHDSGRLEPPARVPLTERWYNTRA